MLLIHIGCKRNYADIRDQDWEIRFICENNEEYIKIRDSIISAYKHRLDILNTLNVAGASDPDDYDKYVLEEYVVDLDADPFAKIESLTAPLIAEYEKIIAAQKEKRRVEREKRIARLEAELTQLRNQPES